MSVFGYNVWITSAASAAYSLSRKPDGVMVSRRLSLAWAEVGPRRWHLVHWIRELGVTKIRRLWETDGELEWPLEKPGLDRDLLLHRGLLVSQRPAACLSLRRALGIWERPGSAEGPGGD